MARTIRVVSFPTSGNLALSLRETGNSIDPPPTIVGIVSADGTNEAGLVVADDANGTLTTWGLIKLIRQGEEWSDLTAYGDPIPGYLGTVRMLDGTSTVVIG